VTNVERQGIMAQLKALRDAVGVQRQAREMAEAALGAPAPAGAKRPRRRRVVALQGAQRVSFPVLSPATSGEAHRATAEEQNRGRTCSDCAGTGQVAFHDCRSERECQMRCPVLEACMNCLGTGWVSR
jgi:hypothetical protein